MCDNDSLNKSAVTAWPTDDDDAITIAGIFDKTSFDWGDDLFEFTFQMIKGGWFDFVDPDLSNQKFVFATADSQCDESAAVRAYWDLRGMHGIVGARCSGASISMARIAALECVPQVSSSSTSSKLSDKNEFPYFSRLVAPDDYRGEVGATVAMLRSFGWDRVTILATDNQFSKDWTNEFKRLWMGPHDDDTGKWTGDVAYSNDLRLLADGSLDVEGAKQVLKDVPTDDPTTNSRVVLLVAHETSASSLLNLAKSTKFQPDTIWVGPSSWTGRTMQNNALFDGGTVFPGYLGVAPLQYRGDLQLEFLSLFNDWQVNRAVTPWDYQFPTFAAETVDSIVVMATALLRSRKAADEFGESSTVKELRKLQFEGVSGSVAFTDEGDRMNAKFAIIQANSTGTWTEVGFTGTEVGTAEVNLREICFPDNVCGVVPLDSYPIPKDKLAGWVLGTIIPIAVLLLGLAAKHWASTRSKRRIKAELKAFRDSVVATRAVVQMYVPWTSACEETSTSLQKETSAALPSPPPQVEWHWQETACNLFVHAPDVIADTNACWIKYSPSSSAKLESAYQRNKRNCSPLDGYVVDFKDMLQINQSTKFERAVQRVVVSSVGTDLPLPITTNSVDFSAARIGTRLPEEISKEPQMLLLPGDIVQVSKTRPDGLSFGTKLYSADENLERAILVLLASKILGKEPINVTANSGWFEAETTRVPTSDDLKPLKANVGDSAVLDPPDTWDKVVNPTIVQLHDIHQGTTEFHDLAKAFYSTLDRTRVKILNIQRVQNLAMWQSYVVKRQSICYRDNTDPTDSRSLGRIEKRWLYHGTNIEVLDRILQQGFNRSFCGKNATVYGKGIYHARDASYSLNKTYAVPDRQGNQYIMACRVAVGEYCSGKYDAITPDVRCARTYTLYDSTVDSSKNPTIFVTYHDAQAYPEYIIKFKQV